MGYAYQFGTAPHLALRHPHCTCLPPQSQTPTPLPQPVTTKACGCTMSECMPMTQWQVGNVSYLHICKREALRLDQLGNLLAASAQCEQQWAAQMRRYRHTVANSMSPPSSSSTSCLEMILTRTADCSKQVQAKQCTGSIVVCVSCDQTHLQCKPLL